MKVQVLPRGPSSVKLKFALGVQGLKGDTGATGATGPANVLSIGTVTTGEPGSPAAASVAGTSPTQILNLTIPKGDPGPQGIQGPQGLPGEVAGALIPSNNLSDILSASAARDNLAVPALADLPVSAKRLGAKGDGKRYQTAAMTSGSAVLTVTGATFTAADVGKVAIVSGAGPAGAVLQTTIAGFTDATHVTLAATAGTTVTNAMLLYGTNDTAALQTRIRGSREVLPPGIYLVSSTLLFDMTASTWFLDRDKMDFLGSGRGNTEIVWIGTTNDPIINVVTTYTGGTGSGPIGRMTFGDMTLTSARPGVGTAIRCQEIGHLTFTQLDTYNFDLHFDLIDTLLMAWNRCQAAYGRRGVHARRSGFTYPNSLNFVDCGVGGMDEWAGMIEGGSQFNFTRGSCEGNGRNVAYPSRGGFVLAGSGREGGVAANFRDVYFENNNGTADIYLAPDVYTPCSLNVNGCNFNRSGNDANAATNAILVASFGGGTPSKLVHLDLTGSSFQPFAHTPNAAKPWIALGSGPVHVTGRPQMPFDAERPDLPTGVHAEVIFAGTGGAPGSAVTPIRGYNIASVTKNGTGDYTIVYKTQSSGNAIPSGMASLGHYVQFYTQTTSGAQFLVRTDAGVPADPYMISIVMND